MANLNTGSVLRMADLIAWLLPLNWIEILKKPYPLIQSISTSASG
jgi:hypothetical protein